MSESLFNKVASPGRFIKTENPTEVFSCEFCEILKNTIFTEQLQWLLLVNASKYHPASQCNYSSYCYSEKFLTTYCKRIL